VRIVLRSTGGASTPRRAQSGHGTHRAAPRDAKAPPSDPEDDLMAYAEQRLGAPGEAEK
jgi:hypothetical protein